MSKKNIIIDNLNIKLPNGWSGDPVYLARKVTEQIQRQANELQSTNNLSLSIKGSYAGNTHHVTSQLKDKLNISSENLRKNKTSGEKT